MKQDIIVLALLTLSFLIHPSNLTAQQNEVDSHIVGQVGGYSVSYQELQDNYSQNLIDDSLKLEDLKKFVPSYLHYKAKVLEAKELGYFNKSNIKEEFNVYAKQSSYSYWLNNKIKPENFEKYLSRYQTEINASHILISIPENASPNDTLYAFNKLMEAREKWNKGVSFNTLNKEYSTIRKGVPMGGPLPWFSVGVTVKEFEDVIFQLKAGEISKPFRTNFGYHIVKVHEKRQRTPSRLVSHIFVRSLPNMADSVQINKINNAFKSLESGAEWTEIVNQYSEDNLSIPRNGQIGWINYSSRYSSGFIDTVMKLNPRDNYSQVVNTNYGYHIFKIDSVQSYKSEQQKREIIQRQFEKTPYFQKNNRFVIDWIRDYFAETINEQLLTEYSSLLTRADSVKIQHIQLRESLADQIIYKFNGNSHTLLEFHRYLKQVKKNEPGLRFTRNWFNEFITHVIDNEMIVLTLQEFPDFKSQLDTFEEGLAVFQITDDYVWSAATVDTTRLYEIYEENPEDYTLGERKFYHLIAAGNDSTLAEAIEFVQDGNSPDSLRKKFTSISVISDSSNVFTEKPFDKLENMKPKEFSKKFEFKNRISVFYLEDILAARKMTFQEAFNKLLTDFQPVREKEWLEKLSLKYNIESYPAQLERAFEERSER